MKNIVLLVGLTCQYWVVKGTFQNDCTLACNPIISLEQAQLLCDQNPSCVGITKLGTSIEPLYYLTNINQIEEDSDIFGFTSYLKVSCQQSPPTTTTTFEFECHRLTNTDAQGTDIAVEMDACKLEIGLKTKNMKVLTDCHFENIDGKSNVVSDIKLDLKDCNFNNACLNSIRTKLQYKQPSNSQYVDLPAKYITNNPAGNKTIKIPLIDIFDLATSQTTNDQQIIQIVNLKIFIGHDDNFVRSHRWDLIVYTNRDQVEVFQIDVDIQETEGCQPGQECIVIADLDTFSSVYTNANFNTVQNPPHKYNVGDIFYAKIKFADPTYTKRLIFIKLYFKSDQNKIFDFSSITTATWDGDGLRIALPLVQPSQGAVIQVNMKISTQNARLLAENEEEQTVQTKFTVSIKDNQNSIPAANQNDINNSNANILLAITILSTLFLLF